MKRHGDEYWKWRGRDAFAKGQAPETVALYESRRAGTGIAEAVRIARLVTIGANNAKAESEATKRTSTKENADD